MLWEMYQWKKWIGGLYCNRPAVQQIVELLAEAGSGSGLVLEAESWEQSGDRRPGERLVAGGPGPTQSAASSLTDSTRSAWAGLDTGKHCYRYFIVEMNRCYITSIIVLAVRVGTGFMVDGHDISS